jgi:hypothetical protein
MPLTLTNVGGVRGLVSKAHAHAVDKASSLANKAMDAARAVAGQVIYQHANEHKSKPRKTNVLKL